MGIGPASGRAGVLVLATATLWTAWGCAGPDISAPKIVIAAPALEQSALLYVADARGYFEDEGLDVEIQDHTSGTPALDALRSGEAQIAEAAEFPVARAIMQGNPLCVIATNDRFQNDYVIARKDSGVQDVGDLRGKRIGVVRGSTAEFFLGRFIELHGLSLRDVELVDVQPDEFVTAITSKDVDALIAWQPYVSELQRENGALLVWPAQNDQPAYSLLVCQRSWLTENRDTAVRLLRALAAAEDYALKHPSNAQTILAERLGYEHTYVTSVWDEHLFGLSLDFSLVAAMDDESYWLVSNGMLETTRTPDFRDALCPEGLRAVRPDAVGIGD